MMKTLSPKRGLGPRLERLTGTEASCCLDEFRGLGRSVRQRREFGQALRRARAIADPSRLAALSLLKGRGEMCACEIQAALGVSHATVSHHMHRLLDAGLVSAERRGKWAVLPTEGLGRRGGPMTDPSAPAPDAEPATLLPQVRAHYARVAATGTSCCDALRAAEGRGPRRARPPRSGLDTPRRSLPEPLRVRTLASGAAIRPASPRSSPARPCSISGAARGSTASSPPSALARSDMSSAST